VTSGRPAAGEYASYAQSDIDAVAGDDAVSALSAQMDEVIALFAALDDAAVRGRTYATGKWTLKEVLGHLADDERIFAYRMLCIARGDTRELPGFDENEYMAGSRFESRPLAAVIEEYRSVRAATLTLLQGLDDAGWLRRGIVNGYEASVRGLAFHVAGHELHHLRTLHAKYGL
jgi:uncharacterized damage-inducible protein DinB